MNATGKDTFNQPLLSVKKNVIIYIYTYIKIFTCITEVRIFSAGNSYDLPKKLTPVIVLEH